MNYNYHEIQLRQESIEKKTNKNKKAKNKKTKNKHATICFQTSFFFSIFSVCYFQWIFLLILTRQFDFQIISKFATIGFVLPIATVIVAVAGLAFTYALSFPTMKLSITTGPTLFRISTFIRIVCIGLASATFSLSRNKWL